MRKNLIFFARLSKGISIYLLIALLFVPGLFSDFGSTFGQAETKQVTGKITDMNNAPLPGVTVLIKGTNKGAVTDIDGAFTLNVAPTDVLVMSYVGYLTEEITVGDQTSISVSMSEDIIGLNEVVVTGYGVQKKSDLTGSIASVSGDNLAKTPVAGVDQALQGKAAGVNIIAKSGRPGEGSAVLIRGVSSINGADPLVILDGIPTNLKILSTLNSADIESIEVLKDASSAAIYGATGGNGVIIITSKKGKTGKMITNLNFYRGYESAAKKLDLMNSQQWLETYEEGNESTVAATSRPDTFPNYDWQDYIFQRALTQNYDISFQGGTEKSKYLVSGSYNNQEGIIRNSGYERYTLRVNSEHQVSKRITIDEKILYIGSKRKGFNDHLWHEYYDGPIRPSLQMIPCIPDYLPEGVYSKAEYNNSRWANPEYYNDIYGISANGINPLAKLDMIDRTERNNIYEANLGIKIDILKGLSFTSRFDGKVDMIENKEFQDAYWNTNIDKRQFTEIKLLQGIQKTNSYTAQQLLNYTVSLAQAHNINIMLGMEAYQQEFYDLRGERNMESLPSNLQYFVVSIDDTSSNQLIEGTGSKLRALSYFGRLNYDYKGKYLLSVSLRRDGRSNFGPDKRIGYFPALSLGWKFSEEGFMKNQTLISFGKIRFGYGETGTYAKSGTPYLSLVRSPEHFGYPFNNNVASTGSAPVQLENPEIHWEAVKTTNIGIDLNFLDNKFSFTAEYYSKINDGMLMLKDVPYVSGTYTMGSAVDGDNTSPEVNFGSIKNWGYEFNIGYRKMDGDLKGSIDVNFATLKNEILDLASDSMRNGGVHTIAPITLTRVGGSVSEFYGYETDGIFRAEDPKNSDGTYTNQAFAINAVGDTVFAQKKAQAGDVRFKDLNGDGKINDDDRTTLGSPLPKFTFGLTINLEYKGFDFSASINGTAGNKLFNGTKQYLYYYQGTTNHSAEFANRYVENDIIKADPITGDPVVVVHQNRDTDIPRNDASNYSKSTKFFIEDASYVRLKSVTLGYTIPSKYTKYVNIEKFRIYVGATNLLTFTKYSGLDPEAGFYDDIKAMGIDVGSYPVTKMYLFGANITF